MDGTFVKELERIARPTILNLDGVDYADRSFSAVLRPVPQEIVVHTLQAVVDYCRHEMEDGERYLIHIKGPDLVCIRSRLSLDLRQREIFLSAGLVMREFAFGVEHDVEQFVIQLQSLFVQDATTERILGLVGNITAEARTTVEDDGVTQRVTAKAGIARVEEREVPNPVTLRPYRTFTEIEQPASSFVLRIKGDGRKCALYEADGGAWKNEAISSISGWLGGRLGDLVESGVITILA